jgi:hypothetical protein
MSASFTTFCSDAIGDAAIHRSKGPECGNPIMVISLLTDTGDYLCLHFKDKNNFHAFCLKHNFDVEDHSNDEKN